MDRGFLRVAVANPEIRVADPDYNAAAIIDIIKAADGEGAELLAFPELCITGSTCGDLFLSDELTRGAENALVRIADFTRTVDMLVFVGLPVCHAGKLYNVCAAIQRGVVLGLVPETNHTEAESRYFHAPTSPFAIDIAGRVCSVKQMLFSANGKIPVGVEIGEDLLAPVPPSSDCAALVTVNIAASCETVGDAEIRRNSVKSQSLRTISAYVYANAGRGESTTDAVFSGHGIIAELGTVLAENKPFGGNILTVADIDTDLLIYGRKRANAVIPDMAARDVIRFSLPDRHGELRREVNGFPFVPSDDGECELILNIQTEGLRKRLKSAGAEKLVLGVSGGLDSALALLVCLRVLDCEKMPRKNLLALSMPGFGTSAETAENALALAVESKVCHRIIDIKPSVAQHLRDIGHDSNVFDAAYENAQARMRTVILMDVANAERGIVVGTGDLSEAALGWCTYNGDHMSMYGVNASVPKTLVKRLVAYEAERIGGKTAETLRGILGTEISPELLPTKDGKISQKTEDIIGSYELNDFLLYYAVKCGCTPEKTLMYAAAAFGGNERDYREALERFYKRFFASQFKRSCSPDGAKTGFSLSPRGDWRMPSDASVNLWLETLGNRD